jgi:hypothetical protein
LGRKGRIDPAKRHGDESAFILAYALIIVKDMGEFTSEQRVRVAGKNGNLLRRSPPFLKGPHFPIRKSAVR